jgi:hypothetical protein
MNQQEDNVGRRIRRVGLLVYGTERGTNCKHRAPMAGRTELEPVWFVTKLQ